MCASPYRTFKLARKGFFGSILDQRAQTRPSASNNMISHLHKCIFVHIPKTGGTSVEDLIWPQISERSAQDLWMGKIDQHSNKYQTGGLQHLLARQIQLEVGHEVFDSYFKFTMVRNPWDRLVSQYAHMSKRKGLRNYIGMKEGDPLKRYLELIGKRRHVQWEPQTSFILSPQGHRLVDFIGRFENFNESVMDVLTHLGLGTCSIPHAKRGERGPYQSYYDLEAQEIVADRYAADIELFGYEFEP